MTLAFLGLSSHSPRQVCMCELPCSFLQAANAGAHRERRARRFPPPHHAPPCSPPCSVDVYKSTLRRRRQLRVFLPASPSRSRSAGREESPSLASFDEAIREELCESKRREIGHMAMVTESSQSIVTRSWTVMIIFCFAGCAAGSCLSYGHACWGAHGKRSAHQPNNLRLLPATKPMSSDVQQDSAMPFGNDQWIMSRLIDTRRLVPLLDNYSERWDTLRKERTLAHRRPNDRKRQTSSENDANEDESNDKEAQDFLQAAKDEREDTPEIILISRSSYKERESKPQDLDLFKLLAKDSEDYK